MCLNIKYYHEIVAMKISNNVDLLIDCSRHVKLTACLPNVRKLLLQIIQKPRKLMIQFSSMVSLHTYY